jgi:hypothetical protein
LGSILNSEKVELPNKGFRKKKMTKRKAMILSGFIVEYEKSRPLVPPYYCKRNCVPVDLILASFEQRNSMKA